MQNYLCIRTENAGQVQNIYIYNTYTMSMISRLSRYIRGHKNGRRKTVIKLSNNKKVNILKHQHKILAKDIHK